ncbi:MAG: Holliday junction resolvase RuvX, partial [Candidatus Falkowbacteria bacterium]|nr:Holliday junction resolvase RuvX [Candidatus Falkowbacteria bacterium]
YQKSFNNFYNSLSKVISVELIDERLSTKEAVLLMQGQKHKMDEDAVAAMIILQNFFDII